MDQAPYYAVARPLAGAALGAFAGALFGTFGGGLHAAARGTPGLFLFWLLVSAAAGTASGFIMGVCTAVDRAACAGDWVLDEKCRQETPSSPEGGPAKPHNRILAHYQSPNLVG